MHGESRDAEGGVQCVAEFRGRGRCSENTGEVRGGFAGLAGRLGPDPRRPPLRYLRAQRSDADNMAVLPEGRPAPGHAPSLATPPSWSRPRCHRLLRHCPGPAPEVKPRLH